ncbi:hypothetical protein X551_00556 [Methylibium sp. T29]|nr:hypothetical protein X551_00556 [Methylibium sp. T29]EWS61626.1 hypothetical protein Y694_00555 [Methylibium sp. T29-B]
MRWISASMSLLDGTPSLPSAFATRSSKIDSSLSHCWPARACTSSDSFVMRLLTSPSFSSAAAWVLRWIETPSFTSDSNTLPPSPWALANAPSPACQICWAESLTEFASWLSNSCAIEGVPAAALCLSASFCSFLTMLVFLVDPARRFTAKPSPEAL